MDASLIPPLGPTGLLCGLAPETFAIGPATYAWAFAQGVLVDFTPCVYPLIPITVAIFGAKDVSRGRALGLASLYVLGMAVLYTSIGVVVALTGARFGEWLGNPFVVFPIMALLIALAASMFGAFDLQLPVEAQTKLNKVGGAGPLSAFLMGLVSGLISAPCTGPVLLSLLTVIAASAAQGSGVVVGASLLFVYALGMGTLFFAVALGASMWRPGAWMDWVKSIFGIALLVMAFWFARPLAAAVRSFGVLPGPWMLLGGVALLAVGVAIGAVHLSFKHTRGEAIRKGAGVAVAVVGIVLALNNFLHVELKADWRSATSVAEVEALLAAPEAKGRPVLVDFGAEWCGPCKEIEHEVFANADVEKVLAEFTLIKIDVTSPNAEQAAMQKALHAQTLPSVVIYRDPATLRDGLDAIREGKPIEEPSVHVSRAISAKEFLELVRQ